jgi:transcriptional regulator with XRE-family HTH domain
MTPARFRECLAILRLTQQDLAHDAGCAYSLVWRWANGQAQVHPEIAAWLERNAQLRLADPVPRGWQKARDPQPKPARARAKKPSTALSHRPFPIEEARRLYLDEGLPLVAVGNALGFSEYTVAKKLRGAGFPVRAAKSRARDVGDVIEC